jgi:LPS export ABC transporter protein LptC
VQVEGVRFERWENGALRYRGNASSAKLDRVRRKIRAEEVEVEAFEGDRPAAKVHAPRAEIDLASSSAIGAGGVSITDAEGRVLTTSTATLDLERSRAVAPGPVVVRGANFEAHAPSMSFEIDRRVVETPGPAKAVVRKP